jgi:hypothetical protein
MVDREEGFDRAALRALVEADAGSPEFPALAEAERRGGHPERARAVAEAGLTVAPGRLAGRVALGLALIDLGRSEEARTVLAGILDPALEPHRIARTERLPAALDVTAAEAVDWPAEPADQDLGAGMPAGVGDDELDLAFAVAEPQIDEMISPNRMAEQVLLDHDPVDDSFDLTDDDDDDGDPPPLELDEEEDGIAAPGPAFRTATMAELLARQGDAVGAEAIRRELERRRGEGAAVVARPVDAAVVLEQSPFAMQAVHEDDRDADDLAPGRTVHILATLERWLENIQRGRA